MTLHFGERKFSTVWCFLKFFFNSTKIFVVTIKINGFRRAFDKKGLRINKTGVQPTMEFKKPLDIDYDHESAEEIMDKIFQT